MSLWKIVLKNILQRRLSSTLTAASIGLGVAVVIAVLSLRAQSREGFSQSAYGYELVVGAKGSPLQLVLNVVYHMDDLSANLSYARFKELAAHKAVALAIPMSDGDSFHGARIIGTTDAFFTGLEVQPGRHFELEGRHFRFDPQRLERAMAGQPVEGVSEAVLGASAATKTGLKIGDRFQPSHGVGESGEKHAEEWTVVGILQPTGTPNDRVIFINLDSFYEIREHKKAAQVSAVIVKTRSEGSSYALEYDLNQLPDCTAASPAKVMAGFFERFDWVPLLLLAVSILVVVMASVSVLVAITNSMSERRRPIAILRALGARRSSVLAIILLEALALCAAGAAGGILLGHLLTAVAGAALSARSGIPVSAAAFQPEEFVVLGGVLVLGALAGILPAIQAYRTDIADGLSPSS
ncbi:MAG TPA: FtsX-like permease family protein [Planctomycetota bacterium]|nr:FtsX-like permease family protein [Planctomycetota bacterium]